MADHCARCGKGLGTLSQGGLPGTNTAPKCIDCVTADRATMILDNAPSPSEDFAWSRLSDFEREFLTSVRRQFTEKGNVSEKQMAVLERIWERC